MATVLGSPAAWAESFQGIPFPTPNFTLVFVGDAEEEESRAAASASSCGFQRSLVLDGGLQQLAGGVAQPQADLRFINRDALAVLLGMAADEATGGGLGGVVHAPQATLIDVRRSDERALYGAIKGAMHIPGGLGGEAHGCDASMQRLASRAALPAPRHSGSFSPASAPPALPSCGPLFWATPACSGSGGERAGTAARPVCRAVPLPKAERRRPCHLFL